MNDNSKKAKQSIAIKQKLNIANQYSNIPSLRQPKVLGK
jgi:hypothetical protein